MGDPFRIGRRGALEPPEDLDFITSTHDWRVVALLALLLVCALVSARFVRAAVFVWDVVSFRSSSNNKEAPQTKYIFWVLLRQIWLTSTINDANANAKL
jgi:hypothetical protein